MATQLDPDFRVGAALEPWARRLLTAQLTPAGLGRRLEHLAFDTAELASGLPRQLHQLLDALGTGRLEIHLQAADLHPLVARIERTGNRLAASVIAAALINAIASQLAAGSPQGWRRLRSRARLRAR